MEKTETVVEENENGRVSWINHGLIRAFITGCVLAISLFVGGFLITSLGGQNLEPVGDFPLSTVIHIFLPITVAYFVVRWTNKLLKPFGFEGVKFHKNEKLGFLKLFSAISGCLLVLFLPPLVWGTGRTIVALGSENVGEAKFILLIGAVIVGIPAFFALARRVSHNQAKEQQETQ